MRVIEYNDKEYPLEFTYTSIKHIVDFDINEITDLEHTPFKIIPLTEELLYGAINNNPKKLHKRTLVERIVEDITSKGELFNTFTMLVELLEESDFFKNLQA